MMNLGSEMFEGDHRDDCSVDDFITHLPAGSGSPVCQEFCGPNNRLRVFGYPGTSKFSASAGSMVDKIIRFLQSLSTWFGGFPMLLQLWTPIRCSSGGVVLTVSEQPFAIMKLCKGLCRYRYSCIQQDIDVEGALVGPIGKVFSLGYAAFYDSNSSSLSNFDFAKPYGIGKDWKCHAYPLYECDNADNGLLQQCAGVLELFSYCPIYSRFVGGLLKRRNIEVTRLDILLCFRARYSVIKSTLDRYTLHCLRKELKSLLIQAWLPCMCHTTSGSTNEFLCTLTSMHSRFEDDDYTFLPHGSCTGEILNPLVSRACSENKTCFIRGTSQLSISYYPLVYFARSNRLKDCFVVPLKSIHPELPPLALEVFLPHLQNCDQGNFSAQLNSLLSTVARVLSKRNAAFGLQENEEYFVSKYHPDNDNVIFFETRPMARVAAIGQGTEDSGQDGGIPDAFVETVYRPRRTAAVTGDDEIERSFSLNVKATCRGKTAMFPLHNNSEIEELHRELEKRFKLEVGRLDIKYKDEDSEWIVLSCNEDLRFHVQTLKESGQSTLILEINPVEEAKLTLEKINQYRGSTTQKEAAKELNVSLSTLKRRCRELRLGRWPSSKRKKVHGLHSSAELNKTEVIQESAIRQCSNADAVENEGVSANGNCIETENDETASHDNEAAVANSTPMGTNGNVLATGNDEIGHCVTNNTRNSVAAAANSVPMGDIGEAVATGSDIITVIATYNGDNALFPLCCNSGFEELRKELDATFKFGAEKFKIKYKYDDGRWITLFRDKDLRFHIDTLKASGQSTMELSVFTDSL